MVLTIDEIPFRWVRKELQLERAVQRGDGDFDVQRVQEWLTLNGVAVVVDGLFGPATEYAVSRFQSYRDLPKTGVVDDTTFAGLTHPLLRVLASPSVTPSNISAGIVAAARQHCRERPREVGGANRGPWVRIYMEGADGRDFPWCAGFAGFTVRQAAWHAGVEVPIRTSFSCDVLSRDAQEQGRFVPQSDILDGRTTLDALPRGSFFLQRQSDDNWNHVGIVIAAMGTVMETIEGNTNDDGSPEGIEVCRRIRSLENKDFVTLQPLRD